MHAIAITLICLIFGLVSSAAAVEQPERPTQESSVPPEQARRSTPSFSFTFAIGTPANILPFTGLYAGTYYRNKFNFGLGAGISGPYLAAGFHYFQTYLYCNTNLSEKWYLGAKIGYRAMTNFALIKSKDFPKDSAKYFEKTGSTNSAVLTMPIYVGYHFSDKQSIEVGADIQYKLYKYNSFDYNSISPEARNSLENQALITEKMNSIEKYFNMFEIMSWFYLSWNIRL